MIKGGEGSKPIRDFLKRGFRSREPMGKAGMVGLWNETRAMEDLTIPDRAFLHSKKRCELPSSNQASPFQRKSTESR